MLKNLPYAATLLLTLLLPIDSPTQAQESQAAGTIAPQGAGPAAIPASLIEQLKSIGADIKTEGNVSDGAAVEITFKYTHTPALTPGGAKIPPYPMTDDLLAQVSKLPKLTHLELNMCSGVTDTGMASLKGMTQLQQLALTGARVTDTTMSNLAGLTNLKYFRASGATRVTTAGWAVIQNWKQLQTFWVAESSFNDSDMQYLKGLTQLKDITFYGDGITDAGVEVLLGLPNLTSVRVGPRITSAEVAKLHAALPNCRFWR